MDAKRAASGDGVCLALAGLFEHDPARGDEPEQSSPGLLDPDANLALVEPAAEQDEAWIEVLGVVGQLQSGIEAQLAIAELRAAGLDMLAQETPEDRAGYPLDEVVVIEEHAVIARIMPNRHHALR